ncbi:MAG: hypothetical protein IPO94_06680 [Saprospiraceae bacterium]|nr:hypothetical protein [Saprospiraceae bacterium]
MKSLYTPGVMFSGSLSDIVILKANGMPYTITPTIGYDPMTNKITFTFTNVNPMQDKMKILFNNIYIVIHLSEFEYRSDRDLTHTPEGLFMVMQ